MSLPGKHRIIEAEPGKQQPSVPDRIIHSEPLRRTPPAPEPSAPEESPGDPERVREPEKVPA